MDGPIPTGYFGPRGRGAWQSYARKENMPQLVWANLGGIIGARRRLQRNVGKGLVTLSVDDISVLTTKDQAPLKAGSLKVQQETIARRKKKKTRKARLLTPI